jgi:hypothetical protein
MGGNSGRTRKATARSKNRKQSQSATMRSPEQSRSKILYRVPVVRALLRGGEWSRPDTLTALGLAVATIGAIVVPTLVPIFSGTSGPALKTSGPALRAEEVEIALAKNIDASVQVPGTTTPGSEKDTGSAIDITLRNSGEAPALIVKAIFSFTRTTELDSCAGGAGAGVSTAQYDVKVPTAKPVTVGRPFTLHRDMRFVINANSVDRFRISVGPDKYSSVSWPWIYEFNLSLVEDDGQRLDLGPMSILGFSTSGAAPTSWDPLHSLTPINLVVNRWLPCVNHVAAEVARAVARPGLHSPELQMFYHEAERLTANAPPCRQIPITQNPYGCPAPDGRGSFLSDSGGVNICSDKLEVLAGFTCDEAEYIMKEYEEVKAPRTVSMTFTVFGNQAMPMQCLPNGRAEVCRGTHGQGLVVGFIP